MRDLRSKEFREKSEKDYKKWSNARNKGLTMKAPLLNPNFTYHSSEESRKPGYLARKLGNPHRPAIRRNEARDGEGIGECLATRSLSLSVSSSFSICD